MFEPPKIMETEVYARMPEEFYRWDKYSEWVERRRQGPHHSFLEGPSFDRAGNLYCVDLAHGRIFKITPDRQWHVFAEYGGEPNGLKIHKDGRIFVADHKLGLLCFDPETGAHKLVTDRGDKDKFIGLNDLSFSLDGDLYVTDQGDSGFVDMQGAVYRLRRTGEMDYIFKGLPSPNGLVLNKAETTLHVSITRSNQVLSCPLTKDAPGAWRTRVFLQLSGGGGGPDGMAIDEDDNLVVVHAALGTVWVFSALGEPLYRVKSCAGIRTTNVAYGDADRKSLFITEAQHAVILSARMPVAGRVVYGLS